MVFSILIFSELRNENTTVSWHHTTRRWSCWKLIFVVPAQRSDAGEGRVAFCRQLDGLISTTVRTAHTHMYNNGGTQATNTGDAGVHTGVVRRRGRGRPLARIPRGRYAQRRLAPVLRHGRRGREHAGVNGALVEWQRPPVIGAAERHALWVQVTVQWHGRHGRRRRRRLQVRQRRRFVLQRRVETLQDRAAGQVAGQRRERGLFLGSCVRVISMTRRRRRGRKKGLKQVGIFGFNYILRVNNGKKRVHAQAAIHALCQSSATKTETMRCKPERPRTHY